MERKPNIILILADDMGYGDAGCYGGKHLQTPAIDTLADKGLRFTDFHSNAPVCSPTRAALLTGCYQQRCGIEGVISAKNHRKKGLSLENVTFATTTLLVAPCQECSSCWAANWSVRVKVGKS
jgi:arylsulfatase A-like enzyme